MNNLENTDEFWMNFLSQRFASAESLNFIAGLIEINAALECVDARDVLAEIEQIIFPLGREIERRDIPEYATNSYRYTRAGLE